MSRSLLRWLPALLIVGTALYTWSIYQSLPATMPMHWGIDGRPNGWGSSTFGAWLVPATMVLAWMPGLVTPKRMLAIDVIVSAIVAFEAVVQIAVLGIARGQAIDINAIIYSGVAAIFLISGLALAARVR